MCQSPDGRVQTLYIILNLVTFEGENFCKFRCFVRIGESFLHQVIEGEAAIDNRWYE